MSWPYDLLPSEYGYALDPATPMAQACAGLIRSVRSLQIRDEVARRAVAKARIKADSSWELERALAVPAREEPLNDTERFIYTAPPVKQPPFLLAWTAATEMAEAQNSFPGALIGGLISAYDTFLADLVRAAYSIRPELLNSSVKDIRYEDVIGLGPDEVRDLFIEKEVSNLLHNGHRQQLSILAARLGVPAINQIESIDDFVEICERRNVYVHCGGRVSPQYLKTLRGDAPRPATGSHIHSDDEYLASACDTIIAIAVQLTQTAWRALGRPAELGAADRDLAHLTYTLLAAEQWTLAQRLLKFAVSLPKHSSEQHQLVFVLNYAQTFKWLGNQRGCESILSKHSWEAKDNGLRLGHAVLTDNYELAARLMQHAYLTEQVDLSALDHFPIYREFRTSDEYATAYSALISDEQTA